MLAPVDLLRLSRQEAYEKGVELLRMVGLAEKADSYPDELATLWFLRLCQALSTPHPRNVHGITNPLRFFEFPQWPRHVLAGALAGALAAVLG